MKISQTIKKNFLSIKESNKKYPITILISFINFILLIYYNENMNNMNNNLEHILGYIKVLFILIPLSVFISNVFKKYNKNQNINTIITLISSLVSFILLNLFLKNQFEYREIYLIGAFLFSALLAIFIDTENKYNYEFFINTIVKSYFLTAIYSMVLYIGIAAIIFTVNSLFDANIDEKYYYYTFLFIVLVFAVSMFLSKIPKEENKDSIINSYSKGLKILITYIIIPLLTIYTLILYIYLGKILITSNWPQGIVSHLILWYSVISILILIYINPINKESKILDYFYRFFPIAVLPVYIMMFISINIRINQYGLTENRYLVILLAIWSLLSMIFLILKRKTKLSNQFITIGLIVFTLISAVGPLSALSLSAKSQNKRLHNILAENNMIQGETIISNQNVNEETEKEINSVISYFEERDFKYMDYVSEDFKVEDTKKVFGFNYKNIYNYPSPDSNESEYFSLNTNLNEFIDISPYSYATTLYINEYEENTVQTEGDIRINIQSQIVDIYFKDEKIITVDIGNEVKKLIDTFDDKYNLNELTPKQSKIEISNNKIDILIIPSSLAFHEEKGTFNFEYMESTLYFKIK